jgi:hypothetical protein
MQLDALHLLSRQRVPEAEQRPNAVTRHGASAPTRIPRESPIAKGVPEIVSSVAELKQQTRKLVVLALYTGVPIYSYVDK